MTSLLKPWLCIVVILDFHLSLMDCWHSAGALLVTAAITLHCIIFGALFRPLKAPKKKVLDAADAETAQAEANQPAEVLRTTQYFHFFTRNFKT